jgi:hypothetical protein
MLSAESLGAGERAAYESKRRSSYPMAADDRGVSHSEMRLREQPLEGIQRYTVPEHVINSGTVPPVIIHRQL